MQGSGVWIDNEPAGMTPIVFVDGSTKAWPGFRQNDGWMDDSRVAVVGDAESKYGKAVEKRFYVGDRSGWHGTTYRNLGAHEQLYFRLVFRFSRNWQYHTGMNKLFYWGGSGRPSGHSPTQFFLGIRGGFLELINQAGDRSGANAGGTFRANALPISLGEYHTVEIVHVANTPGKADGSARMWINGVEVQSFNHLGRGDRNAVRLENLQWLDYGDPRLTGLEAVLFWGGQGDTKRVNDWIRVSELYISGSGRNNSDVGEADDPSAPNVTGIWSFSATAGNADYGVTCEIESTADLSQDDTKFDGSMAGTAACSWPGRSTEWDFNDTVVGNTSGDNIVFEMVGTDARANGTASGDSMSGRATWRVDTGDQGVVVLTGGWSGIRQ